NTNPNSGPSPPLTVMSLMAGFLLDNRQRCVLKMRGLPFSCNEQDVVQFFSGYQLNAVQLGRLPNGKLTGDALVLFGSEMEATHALHTKHKSHIGSRF